MMTTNMAWSVATDGATMFHGLDLGKTVLIWHQEAAKSNTLKSSFNLSNRKQTKATNKTQG
jgi:hypothetical protein